jgi:hypothetical protein
MTRSGRTVISPVGEDASEPTQAVRQAALAAGWSHRHRDVSGGRLRPTVFGAVDGLVTNASLIAGLAGGGAPSHIVILTGAAALVAGAFSMGTGEYISVTNPERAGPGRGLWAHLEPASLPSQKSYVRPQGPDVS